MADGSKIEWTDATWNPIRGCTRVSPGCGGPGPHGGCYAEQVAARFSGPDQPYEGLATVVTRPDGKREGRWTGKVTTGHNIDQPLRWRRPRKIFVNSMSDLFHEDVPDAAIDEIYAVMALCPQHTFQVLTKRPERMRGYLTDGQVVGRFLAAANALLDAAIETANKTGRQPIIDHGPMGRLICSPSGMKWFPTWPLPNVWLGVSVEDQQRADERIPILLDTPAAVRWISAEPLLGPIDLEPWLEWPEEVDDPVEVNGKTWGCPQCDAHCPDCPTGKAFYRCEEGPRDAEGCPDWVHCDRITLDWIVAGGESGPGARPMNPDWARSLRDQCAAAGVPFLHKQNGAWASVSEVGGDGAHHRFPDGATVRLVGKKVAGRTLDGLTHDAFPEAGHAV